MMATAERNAEVRDSHKARKEFFKETSKQQKTDQSELPDYLQVAPVAEETWRSGLGNRFLIRAFTRGVLGAAGYAWGFHNGGKFFTGYSYDFEKSGADNWKTLKANKEINATSAKGIARGIAQTWGYLVDRFIGGGMHKLGKKYGKEGGSSWAEFRNTSPKYKRSLSKEMWGVTFDFAMSSTGDAIGDEFINIMDPNHKTPWLKGGKINWTRPWENRIDFSKLLNSVKKSVWKIFSYRQGEDWMVALPYVYICRAIAHVQDKKHPGWKRDFESLNRNGASLKVDFSFKKETPEKGELRQIDPDKIKITGNYTRQGFTNLWARFWLYNDLTRKYREVYNALGWEKPFEAMGRFSGRVNEWAQEGGKLPSLATIAKKVKLATRWAVGESIKSAVNMIPAAAVFSTFRVQQRRDKGFLINEKDGVLYQVKEGIGKLKKGEVYSEKQLREHFGSHEDFNAVYGPEQRLVRPYITRDMLFDKAVREKKHATNKDKPYYAKKAFKFSELDPTSKGGIINGYFDVSGEMQYSLHTTIAKGMNTLPVGMRKKFGLANKDGDSKGFAREWVHAGASYFPYFFAKSDWLGPMAYSDKMDKWVDKNLLTPVFGKREPILPVDLQNKEEQAPDSPFVEKAREKFFAPSDNLTAANQPGESRKSVLEKGGRASFTDSIKEEMQQEEERAFSSPSA